MVFSEVGLGCVTLHSMIPQRQRLAALAKFKSHQVRILVATDVASRWVLPEKCVLLLQNNLRTIPIQVSINVKCLIFYHFRAICIKDRLL